MRPRRTLVLAAAAFGWACTAANAQQPRIDTLRELFAALGQCWQSPRLPAGHPGMQITVMMSFKRDGQLFGKPKITFESPEATDDDRLAYRLAVMETLQRCSPLPLTDTLGGAVAGRPITMRFDDRRNAPQPIEKRAWLPPKTL